MDINGFSREPMNMSDSNPGRVEYCPGGVGRNIAENLHRLGADVRLISVIGDDPGGEFIKSSSARIGLNIEHSLFIKSEDSITSVYIALMDTDGEMKLALSDMGIIEEMSIEFLESKTGIINESAIVVLDTNLPERAINFILDKFKGEKRFFLDAVSARKASRAAFRIGSFDTLKLGRMEASVLSGIEIPDDAMSSKLEEAAHRLIARGVDRVFITMGKDGVYTAKADRSFFTPVRQVPQLNTSGAGDAFMAGVVYGTLRAWDEEHIVSFSMAMAGITVQSKHTVSPEMCLGLALLKMENEE